MKIYSGELQGVLLIESDSYADNRGTFTDVYNSDRFSRVGAMSGFHVAQVNFVYNNSKGVLRGVHAEPWEKFVGVVKGEAFCAFVDLREGGDFGRVCTVKIEPGLSVFIPRGVGNSYQTLAKGTIYHYAVNGIWEAVKRYLGVNAFDPILEIPWPIDKNRSVMSEKDRNLPSVTAIQPFRFD